MVQHNGLQLYRSILLFGGILTCFYHFFTGGASSNFSHHSTISWLVSRKQGKKDRYRSICIASIIYVHGFEEKLQTNIMPFITLIQLEFTCLFTAQKISVYNYSSVFNRVLGLKNVNSVILNLIVYANHIDILDEFPNFICLPPPDDKSHYTE